MGKKFKIAMILISVILTSGSSLMVLLSPFKKYHHRNEIRNEVIINAPPCEVFEYLGNSSNAAKWSVYVDHITTLNKDKVEDGKVGSIRRCFANQDENVGEKWDELITEVIPCKKRQLSIYNLQNFSFAAEGLLTEQQYYEVNNDKTKLVFTVFYKDNQTNLMDEMKTHFVSYNIEDVFIQNMNNIKYEVENKKKNEL